MKNSFLILVLIFIFSCNKKQNEQEEVSLSRDASDEINLPSKEKEADWSDFQKTKTFESVQDVPFMVYTSKDSVLLYTEPSKSASRKKVSNDKLNVYYGLKDLEDFIQIQFSIENDAHRTIKAYVSKEEFVKDSQLSIKDLDLNSIRYMMVYEKDVAVKTFSEYGKVVLINKQEFEEKKKNKFSEQLIKHSEIRLSDKNWINGKGLIVPSVSVEEEEEIHNEYIGFSNKTGIEVFHQTSDMSMVDYYLGYRPTSSSPFITFSGYPVFYKDGSYIFSFTNNTDVGTDFILQIWDPAVHEFKLYLVANFVNFKVDTSTEAFWYDTKTIYFVATHTNTNRKDQKYKREYVKLILNKK